MTVLGKEKVTKEEKNAGTHCSWFNIWFGFECLLVVEERIACRPHRLDVASCLRSLSYPAVLGSR